MEIEIAGLQWDDFNVEHIALHGVVVEEVKQACLNKIDILSGHSKRSMLFDKTSSGRYLAVILVRKLKNIYYDVTARDTSKKRKKVFK